jgi:hypothetical protein
MERIMKLLFMKLLCRNTAIILALVSCGVHARADELRFEASGSAAKKSARMVKAEMIIEIKRGVVDLGKEPGKVPQEKALINSESMRELNKKYGLVSVERLFSGTRKELPSDIYVFRFPADVDIDEAIADYKIEGDVVYAEANYSVSAQ